MLLKYSPNFLFNSFVSKMSNNLIQTQFPDFIEEVGDDLIIGDEKYLKYNNVAFSYHNKKKQTFPSHSLSLGVSVILFLSYVI